MARMERCMRRARLPDEIVEPAHARFCDGFIDAALLVARREPGSDDGADPGRRKIEHLQAGALRQAFGEELTKDFAGSLVCTDQRGHFEHKAFRMCVAIDSGALVEDSVGQPVRQHVEREVRLRMVSALGVTEHSGKQCIARGSKREAHRVSPSGVTVWGTRPGGGGTAGCPGFRRRSAGQLRRTLGGDNQDVRKLLGEGRRNGSGARCVARVGSAGLALARPTKCAQDIAGRKRGLAKPLLVSLQGARGPRALRARARSRHARLRARRARCDHS